MPCNIEHRRANANSPMDDHSSGKIYIALISVLIIVLLVAVVNVKKIYKTKPAPAGTENFAVIDIGDGGDGGEGGLDSNVRIKMAGSPICTDKKTFGQIMMALRPRVAKLDVTRYNSRSVYKQLMLAENELDRFLTANKIEVAIDGNLEYAHRDIQLPDNDLDIDGDVPDYDVSKHKHSILKKIEAMIAAAGDSPLSGGRLDLDLIEECIKDITSITTKPNPRVYDLYAPHNRDYQPPAPWMEEPSTSLPIQKTTARRMAKMDNIGFDDEAGGGIGPGGEYITSVMRGNPKRTPYDMRRDAEILKVATFDPAKFMEPVAAELDVSHVRAANSPKFERATALTISQYRSESKTRTPADITSRRCL